MEQSIKSEIISPSTRVHILKTFTYIPIADVFLTNTTVINRSYKQLNRFWVWSAVAIVRLGFFKIPI